MRDEILQLIGSVQKPFRYCGGEVGARNKEWDRAEVTICLAFPDLYEIGTSHLGLSILYNIVNDLPWGKAERAYMPWEDMEGELKKRDIPLFSLESKRPLADFDIVGFSLAYELTYTNVLAMLDLAHIPRRAKDRIDKDPIIIAGGPCTYNPMPVAPFFDAIVIGDGESVMVEIASIIRAAKKEGLGRRKILDKMAVIPGIYIPGLRDNDVGRALVMDLDGAPYPSAPIVPHFTLQERYAIEVARGCTRGCRFCQAGYIYRPLRQRSAKIAEELAVNGIGNVGCDSFSFLSLSIGDWRPLDGSLNAVHSRLGEMPISVSLPSLRAESLSQPVIDALGRQRSGSFTLAPEASTERMRRFINKGNTDEDLYASVEKVFASGWHAVKLYFMIGLPTETQAEIDGICDVANRCLDIGKKYHNRPDVTVSTSTFVPKAHTPFQWDRQISIEETQNIQRDLKKRLRRPGLYYKWHLADMSFLEGIISRGGPELANIIEGAYQRGARFDAWDEKFNLEGWRDAFAENGIDPNVYIAERPLDRELPWDKLGLCVSKEFLTRERSLALELKSTPDCATGACSSCGICNKEIANHIVGVRDLSDHAEKQIAQLPKGQFRYRIQYSKELPSSFMGSIEALDALRRGFRAAGLPLIYSDGFTPRPKMASGPALAVGVESACEFVDCDFYHELDGAEILHRLAGKLPQGMAVMAASRLEPGAPAIDVGIIQSRYIVGLAGIKRDIQVAIDSFSAAERVVFVRKRKEKSVEIDLKQYITKLAVINPSVLEAWLESKQPALKISEAISEIFKLTEDETKLLKLKKQEVVWR